MIGKLFKRVGSLVTILLLAGCAARVPSHPENMCTIFEEFPDWYTATKATQEKWGVPVSVQMAIMYHESAFKKEARPPRRTILGIFPGSRPTTAYSYAQVVDGSWDDYRKSTGRWSAKRDDFADAADFVGWYCYQSRRKLGISYDDAYGQYLAYHEGWGGYARGTYNSQAWLIRYSQRVQSRATLYDFQLGQCQTALDGKSKSSWFG